ncbi:[FeFe] hydrogenase H-cluster maturation GTPase HydF [Clostridium beijerinckii]|uniref:[FeFe] hydrogenase H-cluster maturation GTPase HydF n=1 Tax=Clostridium beijerinckii TaxID=1520 RepID=A0A9Q5CV47_CLOBE|nr:[FeFe] hydrogenase H-cluster maturation GTPase HydF [Clostridium beijerinckii]AQS06005.1 tRNA modification GTPase MnmE [Clostridium beijerinckii]MBA2888369.1 [FeFe] hydrogenase H-cluster maturation GTPase HydF [Clostridium beijerinckii]MBA2903137.1 [FeFe] hydrogenase H-cluster maturation GTPase HydF [Clostridium beijerinckii]MBA2912982.1 [FeFe] hydrogenase H-cluster maturation GTPase HydF [Clostridium beijerinckii]MBA9014391.1 [FeFe] hydrogenase H-cluster maturation GTPase HydF [Clostridium
MSLNTTPSGERVHIALFGMTNAGKSSIINALTNQEISIVSDVKGTTTDPVYKAIEILPIGPCMIIDTAGLDDESELGESRKKKTIEVLSKTDVALVVVDATVGVTENDRSIIDQIKEKKIPTICIFNKADKKSIEKEELAELEKTIGTTVVSVSALNKNGIDELKQRIISVIPDNEDKFKLVGDLISPGDLVVLVTPIDKAAPKGRLILPQQQTIRDIIESDAIAIVTKEHELRETLENLKKKPKLVITDSQVFLKASADTPKDIMLTSFSILQARYKGDLMELVKGAKAVESLEDGDYVLISEGCTHHRQCDDIGTVKIPRWVRQMTGKQINFEYSSGNSFTDDVKKYKLIIHCGGCMLNRAAMLSRIGNAVKYEIPIVNYGVLIGYVQGILERALEPFPMAKAIYDGDFN